MFAETTSLKCFLMKLNSFFKLVLVSTVFFMGCSVDDDSVDNTAPIVRNISLNGLTENIIISAGSEIEFDAEFEDDIQLGQYRINIHDNFNGHSHGKTLASEFSYPATHDLEGKSQTVHKHIPVPTDATPGPYHFTLLYFDAAGNEGEPKFLQFEIADPSNQPVIEITSHDILQEIEVAPGNSIRLQGWIEDPDGLEEVHIRLAPEHEDDHNHGRLRDEALFDQEFVLNGATTWEFSEMGGIDIPEDAAHGHYELVIRASDLEGYQKTVFIEVHVE